MDAPKQMTMYSQLDNDIDAKKEVSQMGSYYTDAKFCPKNMVTGLDTVHFC